jgi:class 3 adenylate cyclase
MRTPSDVELTYLLESIDPRDRKLGLQLICETVEAGQRIDLSRNPRLAALVARCKGSADVEVRRWFYKVIGLSRHRGDLPYLLGQLTSEDDQEGLSWAAAALVAIDGQAQGVHALNNAGFSGLEIEQTLVRARYFRPDGPPVEPRAVRRILDTNEPLQLRWLSLVYGKHSALVPIEVIRDMNTHEHPLVAEYSLWALVRDPRADASSAAFYPQDLPKAPANVRRWYYRLLTHDPNAILPNWDVVEFGIKDDDPKAREGLAMGLTETTPRMHNAARLAEWFNTETDRGVRRALMKCFVRNRSRSSIYKALALSVTAASDPEEIEAEFGGILPPPRRNTSSRLFVISRAPKAKGAELFGIPDIHTVATETFVFIAVDTVGFSDRADREQLAIVQSFVDSFRSQQDIARLPSEDVVPLFTGDGLILGIRGSENVLVPLKAALDIRTRQQNLFKYELRFGVHCGVTQFLTLSDGTHQLIGHAVNWTTRVMTCASNNQVLLSGDYWGQVLHEGREELPGYHFKEVLGLHDKRDNPVRAFEAMDV